MSHNGPNPDHPRSGVFYPKDPGLRALIAWRAQVGWGADAEPPRWLLSRAYQLIQEGWDEFDAVRYLRAGGT